jgi:hypothetical protein
MRKLLTYTVLASQVALGACASDLQVSNPNSPTVDGATKDPRAVDLFAQGVAVAVRNNRGGDPSPLSIFGREGYQYFLTDSRTTTGYLVNPEDPNSFSAGVRWAGSFAALRDIFNFVDLIGKATSIDATQKSATLGWAQTWEAHEYLMLVLTRHTLGVPIGVDADPLKVFPFVSRDSAYKYVSGTLDAAYAKLQAGGAAFPFNVNAGFVNFKTPATFALFNRAIAAKTLINRAAYGCGTPCYQQALTALGQSFISASTALDYGAYAIFSTAAGDVANGVSNENTDIYAHPTSVLEGVDPADTRRSKIRTVAARTPSGGIGIESTVAPNVYALRSSPIPFIAIDELILIRAEARWFTGDKAGAIADINTIRQTGGGLGPTTVTTASSDSEFVDELLLQRKIELFFTGNRWFDVRRFNRMTTLPLDLPTHVRRDFIVVPAAECLARARTGDASLAAPGC